MISETQVAKQIYRDLDSNKEQIDQVGIEYIIKSYIGDMAYYKTVDFGRFEGQMVKDSIRVEREGVYYTYFIYETIPNVEKI